MTWQMSALSATKIRMFGRHNGHKAQMRRTQRAEPSVLLGVAGALQSLEEAFQRCQRLLSRLPPMEGWQSMAKLRNFVGGMYNIKSHRSNHYPLSDEYIE